MLVAIYYKFTPYSMRLSLKRYVRQLIHLFLHLYYYRIFLLLTGAKTDALHASLREQGNPPGLLSESQRFVVRLNPHVDAFDRSLVCAKQTLRAPVFYRKTAKSFYLQHCAKWQTVTCHISLPGPFPACGDAISGV